MKKVSVILPVYNSELYLRACLDSLVSQSYKDFEVIAIDDCSTDKSLAILEEYGRVYSFIKIYRNEENKKIVATLNKGLKLASGIYIARMDSDDICVKDRLKKQVEFLDNNKEIGICGSSIKMFGDINYKWKVKTSDKDLKTLLLFGNPFAHPSIMIRKEILEKTKYEEKYKDAEDYKLWSDLSRYTNLGNIRKVLLKYRVSEGSISGRNKESQIQISLKIIEENLREFQINYVSKEMLRFIFTEETDKLNFTMDEFKTVIDKVIDDLKKYKFINVKLLKYILNRKLMVYYRSNKKFNKKNYIYYILKYNISYRSTLQYILKNIIKR